MGSQVYSLIILLKYAEKSVKRAKKMSQVVKCVLFFKCVWLLNSRKTTFLGPCTPPCGKVSLEAVRWRKVILTAA